MGAILGRFRKKKTTLEKLEDLDKDIKSIEKYRFHTQQAQKRIIGQFILISACIYVLAIVVYYYLFFPTRWNEQVYYIIPLLLVPFIIWFVKRLLKWIYTRKIEKNEIKLKDLMKEKKLLLDQVMDTETYKIAKTILEKFAPDSLRKSPTSTRGELSVFEAKTPLASSSAAANTLRHRNLLTASKTPIPPKSLGIKTTSMFSSPAPATNGQRPNVLGTPGIPPTLPMPRGILSKERSVLDKMVEYLVGDGPNNRYALICKNCQSHNGMALREEFEYVAFRCCYCYHYNPARKLRPSAPKLEIELTPKLRRLSSSEKSSSESEKISESDTDSDPKNSEPIKKLDTEQISSKEMSKNVSDNETIEPETKTEIQPGPLDPTINNAI